MTTLNLPVIGLTDRTQRNQTNANFQAVAKAINDNAALKQRVDKLDQELRIEMAAKYKNLQSQIDDKASIEDLNDAKEEWLTRAKHIALGTDLETIEAAVVMVLQKRGMI